MIRENRDWTEYRNLPDLIEVDFHWKGRGQGSNNSYFDKMGDVYETTMQALKFAYENGKEYVLFTHGHSPLYIGQSNSCTIVRGIMRSKESTPYIIKSQSIQHPSVFVAKIRPNPEGKKKYIEGIKEDIKKMVTQIKELLDLCENEHYKKKSLESLKYLLENKDDYDELYTRLAKKLYGIQDQYKGKYGAFEERKD